MKNYILLLTWSMALTVSAFAQNDPPQGTTLVLEATIPGTPASGFIVRNQVAARDFNDDGVPDLAMIDTSDELIVIVDGTDPENRWFVGFDDVQGEENIYLFIDLDPADGLKAILLAERRGQRYVNPFIIDAEGDLLWDGRGRGLLAIDDREADLTERIVVFNPQVPQVEIWGVGNE